MDESFKDKYEFSTNKDLSNQSSYAEKYKDGLGTQYRNFFRELGYVTSKRDAFNLLSNFNILTRPYLETDGGGPYRSFVYFIRPDLNLVKKRSDDTYRINPALSKYPELFSLIMDDVVLASELCVSLSDKSNIFSLLSNHCIEISPVKMSDVGRDGVKNMFDFSMPMAGVSNRNGLDITATFSDTSNGDISKLFYIWSIYRDLITNKGLSPIDKYDLNKAKDYATSVYIITVDVDYKIIAMGVGIDLDFVDIPTHFAQHKADGFSRYELLENFTVNFKCRTYFPLSPLYYDMFNRITGFDPKKLVDTKGHITTLMQNLETMHITEYDRVDSRDVVQSNSGGVTGGNVGTDTSVMSKDHGDILRTSVKLQNDGVKFANKGVFELMVGAPGIYGVADPYSRRTYAKLGFTQIS